MTSRGCGRQTGQKASPAPYLKGDVGVWGGEGNDVSGL